MIKSILFFIFLAVISIVVVGVSNNDGTVTLDWGEDEIETTISFLLLAIAVLFVGILGLYHILAGFFRIPEAINKKVAEQRNDAGYKMLTQGFSAVAAGDVDKAKKLAHSSKKLLKNSPMNLLLSAQVAGLEGDEEKTKEIFSDMTKNKETEAIGLRGLLMDAKKNQDIDKALEYAEQIYNKTPKQEWILQMLLELYAYTKQWGKAIKITEQTAKYNFISKIDATKKKAIIFYEQAKNAGDDKLKILKKAYNTYEGIVPLAVEYAELGKSEKILFGAWKVCPHPDIATAYIDFLEDCEGREKLKVLDKLIQNNPEHYESFILMAKIAVEESLWEEARKYLNKASASYSNREIYQLFADIEEKENGDFEKSHKYLREASNAPEDTAWICNNCGNKLDKWESVCSYCKSFATVEWEKTARNIEANILEHHVAEHHVDEDKV